MISLLLVVLHQSVKILTLLQQYVSFKPNSTQGVTSSLIALISPTRKAARSVNHLIEQLMRSIQSILLSNCKESSKLVVLTNNYSPDYAPFTVDKKGTLEKVPVQIRVGFEILKVFFLKYFFQIDLIKILDINEVDQIFGNQFSLYMTW